VTNRSNWPRILPRIEARGARRYETGSVLGTSRWFRSELREHVRNVVREVERRTSAELVVAVSPHAGSYRHADFGVGLGSAFVVLCVFLYHPRPFDFTLLPVELALAFGFGVVLSLAIPPLRRALVRRRTLDENAERAARAAFVALGVHKTLGRTGLLVHVASFERRVDVVADVNVPAEAFSPARERLDAAVKAGDPAAFLSALRELGAPLGEALPRAHDDVNELADEVAA
jgi:putative membrane protein